MDNKNASSATGHQALGGRLSVALLRAENQRLREQLASMLGEARVNQEKMRRFDLLERTVIGATSLAALVKTLLVGYKILFELDAVSLTLVDPLHEVTHILAREPDTGALSESLTLLDNDQPLQSLYALGARPVLAKIEDTPGFLFTEGPPGLVSVALLPLVHRGKFIGSLNLGSKSAQRFEAHSSTDFLERLASLVAVCLNNALATERLKLAGMTDILTGVHNRRYFDSRCLEEVTAARRSGAPLICMFLDVDRFKSLNDSLGHQAGDEVLRYVASLIKVQLRGSDLVARYGGEEFVVLLPATTLQDGMETAERIRYIVEHQSVPINAHEVARVTISIGVAMLELLPPVAEASSLAADLIARADRAMYQAKETGRNRVVYVAGS
jgi:two-component system, cell cycle response regulator